jgi:phage terminase large subunit-like protein
MSILRNGLLGTVKALTADNPWDLPLLDFVPAATPAYMRPTHLLSLAEAFEESEHHPVFVLGSTPPQHTKTGTIEHTLVWLMLRHPGSRLGYVTYQNAKANQVSLETQWIAERLGLKVEGTLAKWRLPNGSSCLFTGIGGSLTGQAIDRLLVIDDPHKDRAEAESPIIRQRVIDWYRGVAVDRLHPTASVVVIGTRWHVSDLIGQLAEEGRWKQVNLPAVTEEGLPLWPEQRPLEFLLEQKKRIGEYEWWSKWMGSPRPRGSSVFRDVHYYDELPLTGYRVGIGVDMAYTAKTSSDYCAYVVLACVHRTDGLPVFYVLDAKREHADTAAFGATLRAVKARFPGSNMLWYTSTTERGVADLVRKDPDTKRSIPLLPVIAGADKFVRAQPFAAAWNDGRVLLPSEAYLANMGKTAEWVPDFVGEVFAFTGVGDQRDDMVDAGAAAHDLLAKTAGSRPAKGLQSKFSGPLVVPDRPDGQSDTKSPQLPQGFVWG